MLLSFFFENEAFLDVQVLLYDKKAYLSFVTELFFISNLFLHVSQMPLVMFIRVLFDFILVSEMCLFDV